MPSKDQNKNTADATSPKAEYIDKLDAQEAQEEAALEASSNVAKASSDEIAAMREEQKKRDGDASHDRQLQSAMTEDEKAERKAKMEEGAKQHNLHYGMNDGDIIVPTLSVEENVRRLEHPKDGEYRIRIYSVKDNTERRKVREVFHDGEWKIIAWLGYMATKGEQWTLTDRFGKPRTTKEGRVMRVTKGQPINDWVNLKPEHEEWQDRKLRKDPEKKPDNSRTIIHGQMM